MSGVLEGILIMKPNLHIVGGLDGDPSTVPPIPDHSDLNFDFPPTHDEIGRSTFLIIFAIFVCAGGCIGLGFALASAWAILHPLGHG